VVLGKLLETGGNIGHRVVVLSLLDASLLVIGSLFLNRFRMQMRWTKLKVGILRGSNNIRHAMLALSGLLIKE